MKEIKTEIDRKLGVIVGAWTGVHVVHKKISASMNEKRRQDDDEK